MSAIKAYDFFLYLFMYLGDLWIIYEWILLDFLGKVQWTFYLEGIRLECQLKIGSGYFFDIGAISLAVCYKNGIFVELGCWESGDNFTLFGIWLQF